MVGGPSYYRGENHAFVGERAIGTITHGVTQPVRIAGGIGKVIFAFILVHPGGLKETAVMIAGFEQIAVFIDDV